MTDELINNIFMTDANVEGPAIEIAHTMDVQIIRDVDTDVPCDISFYDQCLTEYAVAHGFVLVTVNIKDIAPLYKNLETHPGVVFISKNSRRSHKLIAKRLNELQHIDMTNRVEWI